MHSSKLSKKLKIGSEVSVLSGKFSGKKGKIISIDRKNLKVKVDIIYTDFDILKNQNGAGNFQKKNYFVDISNVSICVKV